jgi:mannose/fructose/N-acetylgalactosamine-specific phosphotransferase system component IIC
MSSAVAGLARSGAVHGAFAFLAMGAWAAFANRDHGPAAMAMAGVIQGAISCAITLILKRSLEAMFARLTGPMAVVVPPLVTMAVVLAVLLTLHTAAGTPEVWTTIAVPYAVSSSYAWIYTLTLRRMANAG